MRRAGSTSRSLARRATNARRARRPRSQALTQIWARRNRWYRRRCTNPRHTAWILIHMRSDASRLDSSSSSSDLGLRMNALERPMRYSRGSPPNAWACMMASAASRIAPAILFGHVAAAVILYRS